MKMYITLVLLLFFVSSCSLMSVDMFSLDEKESSPKYNATNPLWEREERKDYGPVTAADFKAYVDFHTRVTCGETTDELLMEYNIDVDRLVEIGRKYDNQTLLHSVFDEVILKCPDKIQFIEPSIGKVE